MNSKGTSSLKHFLEGNVSLDDSTPKIKRERSSSSEGTIDSEGTIVPSGSTMPSGEAVSSGEIAPAISMEDAVTLPAVAFSPTTTYPQQSSQIASSQLASNNAVVYVDLPITVYLEHIETEESDLLAGENVTAALYQMAKTSPKWDTLRLKSTFQWKTRLEAQSINCMLCAFMSDVQVNKCEACKKRPQSFEQCAVAVINGQKMFHGGSEAAARQHALNIPTTSRTSRTSINAGIMALPNTTTTTPRARIHSPGTSTSPGTLSGSDDSTSSGASTGSHTPEPASTPSVPIIPQIPGPPVHKRCSIGRFDDYLRRVQMVTGSDILLPWAIRCPLPDFYVKKVRDENRRVILRGLTKEEEEAVIPGTFPEGFGSAEDFPHRYDDFLDISSDNFQQRIGYFVTMMDGWGNHRPFVWFYDQWHTWVCILRKLEEGSSENEFELIFYDENWMTQRGFEMPSSLEEIHHLVSAAVDKNINIKRIWMGGREIERQRRLHDPVKKTMRFLRSWCSGDYGEGGMNRQELSEDGFARMPGFVKSAFGGEWSDPEWPGSDLDPMVEEGRGLKPEEGGF
ncbi:hypothetical protein B7494_g339 [Chlorociboria aeruginascens]|nr:hypothetical protein B7494_g339 [Chlorociboria aeruginascens]